ncbi:uncharacterized protein rrp8 isoform 2-T4 [Spinachia spinachia]
MFNEDDDWSDEQDAQVLSKTVLGKTQKTTNRTDVKSKLVGKKSLLRTLQTLGSVPDWKNDDLQKGSDSEGDVVPSHSKRKKKRSKRRKRAETTGEQPDNGVLDPTVNYEKPAIKKRKEENTSTGPMLRTTSEKETTNKKNIISKTDNTEKLSRQQWKTKMKNKRKCKNKYSEDKPKMEINNAVCAEQVKLESHRNNNINAQTPANKNEKKRKLQKLKKTEVDQDSSGAPDTRGPRKEKKQVGDKVTKDTSKSSAFGSKQQVALCKVKIASEQQQSPIKRLKPELSKEEILKREKLRKMMNTWEPVQRESPAETKDEPAIEGEAKRDRSASLRSRMEQRLDSARFRYINEVLYSTSSGEAKRMFQQDPEAFGIYHRGYTAQVQRWPANPVDNIISFIRQKPPSLVVADFGCGDCKIARSVKNKVHSFDLAAACNLVTVCDMANVPLRGGSVDIAVFCLSLMGTNLADFLAEANRVLKRG